MMKNGFWLILGMIIVSGCSPRNYFLVNSNAIVRYDRISRKFELVWHLNAKYNVRDSLIQRSDSIMIPIEPSCY